VRPSGFFATEAFAQNDTSAACFFCVILSAAKDLARQRVSNHRKFLIPIANLTGPVLFTRCFQRPRAVRYLSVARESANCLTMLCSRCGSESYGSRSAFCTRCGASLNRPRYYNAPPARSGWKSLPFVVRLTICALCVPVLIGVLMWLSVLATILSLFRPPT
jgi:ribosomal protein L37E